MRSLSLALDSVGSLPSTVGSAFCPISVAQIHDPVLAGAQAAATKIQHWYFRAKATKDRQEIAQRMGGIEQAPKFTVKRLFTDRERAEFVSDCQRIYDGGGETNSWKVFANYSAWEDILERMEGEKVEKNPNRYHPIAVRDGEGKLQAAALVSIHDERTPNRDNRNDLGPGRYMILQWVVTHPDNLVQDTRISGAATAALVDVLSLCRRWGLESVRMELDPESAGFWKRFLPVPQIEARLGRIVTKKGSFSPSYKIIEGYSGTAQPVFTPVRDPSPLLTAPGRASVP